MFKRKMFRRRNSSIFEVTRLRADLHYGDYCAKLVHFEGQKMFCMLKSTSLERFLPSCKYYLKVGLHNGDHCSKLVPFEAQKNVFYF